MSSPSRPFADSKPIRFEHGERLRLVMVNDTMMNHPMHLHGMWMELENGHGEVIPRVHTVNVKPAEYMSLLITQPDCLLRPPLHAAARAPGRLEADDAVQSVPELGIGSGINGIDLGVRVRYEFWRQFAPYVGISWERLLMETADLARRAGESVGQLSLVAGPSRMALM